MVLVGVRILGFVIALETGFDLFGLRASIGMAFGGLAVALSATFAHYCVRERLLTDDMKNLEMINGVVYMYSFCDFVVCINVTQGANLDKRGSF